MKESRNMKQILPLGAVLVVGIAIGIPIGIPIGIAVCSKSDPDPYAKYRDVQLKRGMKIADLKQQFGEPDRFEEYWIDDLDLVGYRQSRQQSPAYPYHVQQLNYGLFGAHSQESGHVTHYRLYMTFVDGELYNWNKSAPVGRD